jgi:WD40 repeat protein
MTSRILALLAILWIPLGSEAQSIKPLRNMPVFQVSAGGVAHAFARHSTHSVVFSPDGKHLAFGDGRLVVNGGNVGWHRTLHVQDTATGKELWNWEGHFYTLAFSPDEKLLAVSGEQEITLFAAATGKVVRTLTVQKEKPGNAGGFSVLSISSLEFSPDGKMLAVVSSEHANLDRDHPHLTDFSGLFHLWDVVTGQLIRQTQSAPGTNYRLERITADGKVLVWEGKQLQYLDRLLDMRIGKVLCSLAAHDPHVTAAVISPDAKMCAWGDTSRNNPSIHLWDLVQDKEIRRIKSDYAVTALLFSPDGSILATPGYGVKLWETATGKPLHHLRGKDGRVESMAFTPDGKTLATGSLGGRVLVWDVPSGKVRKELLGDKGWILSVCFSPDGKVLAAGQEFPNRQGQSDPRAFLWSVPAQKLPGESPKPETSSSTKIPRTKNE